MSQSINQAINQSIDQSINPQICQSPINELVVPRRVREA
jgi:hypothetical protein